MRPGRDSLQQILERCGVPLGSEQLDLLWAYHQLLRAANPELNLTRIHNYENMVLKHYVDSLLVLKFAELPSPLVDMGSGPGLPGIPLKIARPEVHMILVEPRGARVDFLRSVVEQLGLEGIEVHAGKVGPRFRRRVAGVITRAVASIPETLDLVSSCLEPGGRMLFMKGPDCDDEVAEARRTLAERFRLVDDHPYSIPGTTHRRRLIVYESLQEPNDVSEEESSHTSGFSGPVREVASESNPTFRLCRDVLTGRGIKKHGQALLAGVRPIAEVLRRHPDRVEAWVTSTKGEPPPAEAPRVPWLRLTPSLFAELDVAGTHAPLLLVRVPELPSWNEDETLPNGCTLLVPFQDPENVGAVIRSAAAFQVARVVLLREAAHPFHPKASRAAGTSLFEVPLLRGPSIQDLDPSRISLIALDASGTNLDSAPWPSGFCLLPGVEGPGLPNALRSTGCRRVPIAEGVESLNAATATAIALYEWNRSVRSGIDA